MPLAMWRVWRTAIERRHADRAHTARFRWPRVQFRLLDVAIWSVTVCAVLTAVYRAAHYSGGLAQLTGHWGRITGLADVAGVYSITSALSYILLAWALLWAVYGRKSLWLRVTLVVLAAIVPAFGFEIWLGRIVEEFAAKAAYGVWFRASHETFTSMAAALMMLGSLVLVRSYTLWRGSSK